MSALPDYAALVGEAEKAVQGVKDPELKRIAFQKILDDLIGGGEPRRPDRARPTKNRKASKVRRVTPRSSGSRRGTAAYIQELVDEDFFKEQKAISDLKAELENRGHHIPLSSLSGPLQRLCQARTLRRQKSDGSESKKTFLYSNW
jgi:hypothetical protein